MALGNASDLDYMLESAGVPVVFNVTQGSGSIVEIRGSGVLSIDDTQMVDFNGGTIVGRKHRVTLNAATFVKVVEGSTLEVDGTSYRVTQKWLKSDGKLADCWLALV